MLLNKESSAGPGPPIKERASLSQLLHSAMAARALSLRGLSKLCGINPSTLSRIINNKQLPGMRHLQLLSEHLNIPFERLLYAAGIEVGLEENADKSDKLIVSMINDVLKSYEIELDQVVWEIKKELKKYERYAKTAHAQETIGNEFPVKLKQLKGEGLIINYLQRLYQLFCTEDTEPPARALAGSALLYLLLTPDVIPDYAFPVGYLDDAIAVMLIVQRLSDEFSISLL